MLREFKHLYGYRELLLTWIVREVKARYIQSLFGFAWAIFQPLALTVVFTIVFSYIVRLPSDDLPYPIFVYSAMLPWSFFSRALIGGVESIVGNMSLVTKIYFPRAILPLAAVATHFVDFLCGVIVFIGLLIYYQVPLNPAMGLIPVLFLIQLLLTAGLALGAAAINVFYRDVKQMLPLLLQIWMYACPIIYPVSMVPDWLRPWYLLNPMAVVIDGYRETILKGQWPAWQGIATAAAVSILIFFAGYLAFERLEGRFADII